MFCAIILTNKQIHISNIDADVLSTSSSSLVESIFRHFHHPANTLATLAFGIFNQTFFVSSASCQAGNNGALSGIRLKMTTKKNLPDLDKSFKHFGKNSREENSRLALAGGRGGGAYQSGIALISVFRCNRAIFPSGVNNNMCKYGR